MLSFCLLWAISAGASALLFTALSLIIDRRVFFSTWVLLALSLTALLGPFGTVLTLYFLIDTAAAVHRLRRRRTVDEEASSGASPVTPLPRNGSG